MAAASLPYTLTAGTVENISHVQANFQALVSAVNSIDTSQLDSSSILVPLGLSNGGTTRRGKSIIATTETRNSTSFGTMTTPDQVSNVVLPTDGLIAIALQATWSESVDGAGRAALFIGSNQLKIAQSNQTAPIVSEAVHYLGANLDGPLWTSSQGIGPTTAASNATAYTGDVTTGQVIGDAQFATSGGPCYVFAAAGTYTISLQFRATSGTVTAKNRKLWVWTIGLG